MLFSSSFHKVHCYLIKEMGMMIVVVIYMLAMIMLNVDNGADDIDHDDNGVN